MYRAQWLDILAWRELDEGVAAVRRRDNAIDYMLPRLHWSPAIIKRVRERVRFDDRIIDLTLHRRWRVRMRRRNGGYAA